MFILSHLFGGHGGGKRWRVQMKSERRGENVLSFRRGRDARA